MAAHAMALHRGMKAQKPDRFSSSPENVLCIQDMKKRLVQKCLLRHVRECSNGGLVNNWRAMYYTHRY